jgi:hypothetical protein
MPRFGEYRKTHVFLPVPGIGTPLANNSGIKDQEGNAVMYDREFFTSKLGIAALVSIAAMVTFNVAALTYQLGMSQGAKVVFAPAVALA